MSSTEYLTNQVPDIDQDTIAYIVSIAADESMDNSEKVDVIAEHLSAISGKDDMTQIASEYLDLHASSTTKSHDDLTKITAKAVAECLDVLRVPEVVVTPSSEVNLADVQRRKELMRMYDPDSETVGAEDEMLMGHGPNENKLRKQRERDEFRNQLKIEYEEKEAAKIAQKLKQQGEKMKTVTRKK